MYFYRLRNYFVIFNTQFDRRLRNMQRRKHAYNTLYFKTVLKRIKLKSLEV